MPDQAYDLRQLATRRKRAWPPKAGRPALLAVAGGKGGVGTTTVALGLARALARSGKRIMLVDADPGGGDAAMLCGIEQRYTLADVLASRQTLGEVVHVGPERIQLVAATRGWHERFRTSAAAAHRLLRLLRGRGLQADVAVIDVGNSSAGAAPHVCRRADAVLMLTTADAAAVIDTFAAIKTLSGKAETPARSASEGAGLMPSLALRASVIYLLVNMAPSARVAGRVYDRLAWACRRLLGVELRSAGHLNVVGGDSTRRFAWLSRRHRRQESPPTGSPATAKLNLPALSVDTIRRVLIADVLLNWRSRVDFDGQPVEKIARFVVPASAGCEVSANRRTQQAEAGTTNQIAEPAQIEMDF
jgi:flagellar biosynthesis protein FlhG